MSAPLKIEVGDARICNIPGDGWCLIIVWRWPGSKGRVVEEIISIQEPVNGK